MYLEDSVQCPRYEFDIKKPKIEHSYSQTEKPRLSKEIAYAEDTDFIFKTKEEKNKMIKTVNAVLQSRNLRVNKEKIERTIWRL